MPLSTLDLVTDRLTSGEFHPLPGRCVIELDPAPEKSGSIHLPQTFHKVTDTVWPGKVLAMTPRKNDQGITQSEGFQTGDHVHVLMLMDDMDRRVIVTMNTRVVAVCG